VPSKPTADAVPKERQRDMTTFAIPSVPATPRVGFGRIVMAVRNYHDKRRTRLALRHLDAHLMRDIGLTPRPRDPLDAILKSTRIQW